MKKTLKLLAFFVAFSLVLSCGEKEPKPDGTPPQQEQPGNNDNPDNNDDPENPDTC